MHNLDELCVSNHTSLVHLNGTFAEKAINIFSRDNGGAIVMCIDLSDVVHFQVTRAVFILLRKHPQEGVDLLMLEEDLIKESQ